jgi:hypothetical protein
VTRSIAGSNATLISLRPSAAFRRRSTLAIRRLSRCRSTSRRSFDRRSKACWRRRRQRARCAPTSIRPNCCWLSRASARRMISNHDAWSRCWSTGCAIGLLRRRPPRLGLAPDPFGRWPAGPKPWPRARPLRLTSGRQRAPLTSPRRRASTTSACCSPSSNPRLAMATAGAIGGFGQCARAALRSRRRGRDIGAQR